MATHKIGILGWGTVPDATGGVFFELYSTKATNDNWKRLVCIFNDSSSNIALHGGFTVPQNYVGSASVIASWTSVITTGSYLFGFDYRPVALTESFDQATAVETACVLVSSPSAVNLRQDAVIPLTSACLVAGDEVEFFFTRRGTVASDTAASAAILFNLLFGYTDT